MTTKINLSNIDNEQDYSSLATTLFAKANVAANIANTALATASTILKVTSIVYPGNDTAADTAGGQTITLTGTGFVSGASVLINGSAVGVVSVANSTTLTFTSPSANSGSYVIYVVNPDGGTAISIPGIQYSGTPTWTTAAGSLGSLYETAAFGNTVVATGDTVTYSLQSGTLPPGATFSSNGTITGTSSTLSSPTTYTFTVRATDAQNQDTDRSFSITINPDAVTWSSPTTNTSYTITPNVAMSNVTLAATSAAGASIFYSANTLPTGVSISGNTIFGTPTVSDQSTTSLVTATANTTSESSSIVLNWTVSVASEPFFKYNSLLLSGDGTNNSNNNIFLDSSTNNFAITKTANTTQGTFSPYGANWSNYFPTDSRLTLTGPNLSGLSSFTFECWVNFTSFAADSKYFQAISGSTFYQLVHDSTTGISFSTSVADKIAFQTSNSGWSRGVWYHVAVVKNGNNYTIYRDGVSLVTGTSASTLPNLNVGFIGGQNSTNSLNAYLSNAAISNNAKYTSNFTPSTTPLTVTANTLLLTCADNRFIDDSVNNYALTRVGSASVQRFSPFGPSSSYSTSTIGGSGYFDGSDYLSYPSNSVAAMNFTGDFTVEGWVYPIVTPGDGAGLIGGASGSSNPLLIGYNNTTGSWGFGRNFIAWDQTFNQAPIIGAWQHLAVSRSGTTLRLFVDGVLKTTVTSSQSYSMSGGGTIGWNGSTGFLNGYNAGIRATNTALYTENFTPSTTPPTAVSGTQLLLNFTNAGVIDNTMMNAIETFGNAKISSTQSKFGGTSMYFDGTLDYLTMPLTPNLQFGTGDFTVECWTYLITRTNQYPAIWSNYNGYTPGSLCLFAGHNSGITTAYQVAINGSGFPNIQGGTISYNTWVHLAVVRNSGTIRLYVNGTSVGTPYTTAVTLNGVGSRFFVGTTGDDISNCVINGYVDDLRITKGYARYTSNFTPPTTAHAKL
jgi:hypothetical protein